VQNISNRKKINIPPEENTTKRGCFRFSDSLGVSEDFLVNFAVHVLYKKNGKGK
jgi:hypothetical protein